MQNRLSQGLRALKYLEALMSTEPGSGADRMPCVARQGVGHLPRHSPVKQLRGDAPNRTNLEETCLFLSYLWYQRLNPGPPTGLAGILSVATFPVWLSAKFDG